MNSGSRRTTYDWTKTRVWWSAKHKWSGMVHLAASIGGGRVTRCGIRLYQNGKQYKLYEWQKHGNSPVAPTCGRCLELRKYDLGDEAAKFSGQFRAGGGENGDRPDSA